MKQLRSLLVSAVVLALAACQDTTEPTVHSPQLLQAGAEVPGQYIVVFDAGVRDAPGLARRLLQAHGGALLMTYEHAIQGFAAQLSDAAVTAIGRNPSVAYVEADREGGIVSTQTDPPSWGLDRVDQADLPLDQRYAYNNRGSLANVYILDTGVRPTHTDFGGRVAFVPNGRNGDFVGDKRGDREGALDCHGHGTHVAGTAAGASYGVAKGAPIWAARVVDCRGRGNVSMVLGAVDWVTGNAALPAVVNMSLGYGDVQSLRDAVQTSVAAGVVYAVAAGNGSFFGTPLDACNESPAGAADALTVGATSSSDAEASFSNYGSCVDLLAPGASITSAWYNSDDATNTISGTSMATPHVAGAAALYLSANPGATPAQVANALAANATAGTITLHAASQSGGTPNLFLYTGFIGTANEPPAGNDPPQASFDAACDGLSCTFTDTSTDLDGSVVAWSWDFGDGNGSSQQSPSHTYAAAGTYAVSLAVTDDGGAGDTAGQSVTVSEAPSGGFSLTATGYKVRGFQHADLAWSGAASSQIDVFRDGALVATVADSGSYTDALGVRGGGTYQYRVCEAGTSTCSNTATVIF